MAITTRMAAFASLLAMFASCQAPSGPPEQNSSPDVKNATTTVRRPVLHGLELQDGLNLIDRTPAGVSLIARVVGDEITEWQISDSSGPVASAQKKDDGGDLGFCEVCTLSGGKCSILPGEKRCCWENWGCQRCDAKEQECRMECETQECKDKNSQPGKRGNAPDPGDIATLVPDGSTTFFDASTSRWSVTRPTGEQIHIPLATSANVCAVCTARPDDNTCWALPCLPAKTSTYRPAAR